MTAVKNNQATMHVDLEAIDGARAAGAMKRRKKATAASRADGARLSISATQGWDGTRDLYGHLQMARIECHAVTLRPERSPGKPAMP